MNTREEKNKQIQNEIIKEEREKKVRKSVKIILIISSLLLIILLYGIFIGAKIITVKETKITNELIPISFHGTKLVQISDLLYNSLNENDLKRISKKINELKPDILVFTGDLKKSDYTLSKNDIKVLENFFKNLDASIKKYAVTGDMDDDSFYLVMENSGFQVINNKIEILYNQDIEPIQIIGIDSNNIEISANDNSYYSICLFHNPDKILTIKKKINCNLALAGDTLGGEIRIPFISYPLLDNHKYYKDYYKIDNTKLYISNGIGNKSNIRLFNHPSISLYRLTNH